MNKIRRHARWLRSDGILGYLEEHDINPVVRIPREVRRAAWERRHGTIGRALPLFIVGAQRSGTNMLTHGLEMSPDVRAFNEGNRRAFRDFRLREIPQIDRLIAAQRSRLVVFKPLCDSHRIDRILADVSSTVRPRALWVWRNVDGRVRSAIAKFPTSNLRVIRAWASGHDTDHWQLQRISTDSERFLRSLDVDAMSPATAAAAFWYVRNRLFFELSLDRRSEVMLVSYDRFLERPASNMRRITDFCDLEYRGQLIEHVRPTFAARHAQDDLSIDPRVAARCAELTQRLEAATGVAQEHM